MFFPLLILLLFGSVADAQNSTVEKKGILYFREQSGGIKIKTNGWGVFYEKGKYLNIHRTRIIQFHFDFVRHPKEIKQQTEYSFVAPTLESPKAFKYGKKNSFFALKAGYGYRKKISEKANKNGVEVSMTYLAGVSLGILKPYYLRLIYPVIDSNPNVDYYQIIDQRYSEANADKFLDWYSIYGYSGFSYGLKEITPVPGGFAKFGFNFDWAGYDDFIRALEVGVEADLYYRNVPLMITEKNYPYFVSLYLSFQLGKKS